MTRPALRLIHGGKPANAHTDRHAHLAAMARHRAATAPRTTTPRSSAR